MKRKPCLKDEKDTVFMTEANLKICLSNQQQSFETVELNESLHLQYYSFANIDNLHAFVRLHTLFLNHNLIQKIQNLQTLRELKTLNLSYNRIKTVNNINHLHKLYTLDLSNNLIQTLEHQELQGLHHLHTLKLANNKLSSYQNVKAIDALTASLTYLDLSNNQSLEYDPLFYSELLANMKITVLSLQNTTISRSLSNYRKTTINSIPSLLFLDEKPVTQDQKTLAEAWAKGGVILQRQARQKLKEKQIQKHTNIYNQMEERNQIVQTKRKQVLNKLTHAQQQQLNSLQSLKNSLDYDLLDQDQKTILNLNIEDLQKYLELMQDSVKDLDLDKELGDGKIQLPKMIIDNETPTAIYVYNLTQEQLPIIIEKYYPNATKPVLLVNYDKPEQTRWIRQYDELLHSVYEQARGNIDMLVPLFNLQIYEFDRNVSRKLKRFQAQQLKQRLKTMKSQQEQRQRSIQALYELD